MLSTQKINSQDYKHSTEWYLNIDLGLLTSVIFLDLTKAFSTVDHNILLSKFENCGITETALAWFELYLYNRNQCCSINGKYINSNSHLMWWCTTGIDSLPFTIFDMSTIFLNVYR